MNRTSVPYAVVSIGQELAHDSTSIGAVALAILKREGNKFLALSNDVRAKAEPESIHQMRVTTRRIQAAVKCFRRFLPPRFRDIQSRLKSVFHVLGGVRDLDVDIEHLSSACPESHARRTLIEALYCEREIARKQLVAVLDSQEQARVLAEIIDLTSLSLGALPKHSKRNASEVAPGVIRKRYLSLEKRIRKIDARSAQDEIHDLRKRSKSFRYLIEFFVDLYGKPAKQIVRDLKDLQDDLGTYIDSMVAIKTIDRLRTSTALDEHARELAKDLVEMHTEQAQKALDAFPKARRCVRGKAWKKLGRKMSDVRKGAKRPVLVVAQRASGHLKTAG